MTLTLTLPMTAVASVGVHSHATAPLHHCTTGPLVVDELTSAPSPTTTRPDFNKKLGLSPQKAGFFLMMPELCGAVFTAVGGVAAGYLSEQPGSNPLYVRKVFTSIGFFGAGTAMALLAYTEGERFGLCSLLFALLLFLFSIFIFSSHLLFWAGGGREGGRGGGAHTER